MVKTLFKLQPETNAGAKDSEIVRITVSLFSNKGQEIEDPDTRVRLICRLWVKYATDRDPDTIAIRSPSFETTKNSWKAIKHGALWLFKCDLDLENHRFIKHQASNPSVELQFANTEKVISQVINNLK